MSDTIPRDMTPEQLALAVQNKVALDKDNKEVNKNNEPLTTCYGACELNPDENMERLKNSKFLMDTHNDMTTVYAAIGADTTMTEDHKLLLQANLIDETEAKFNSRVEQVRSDLATAEKSLESKLFSRNPQLDPTTAAMMPALLDSLIGSYADFIGNEIMANAINVLNHRGMYTDPATKKMGKPRDTIAKTLDRKWSPDTVEALNNIAKDKETIDAIARAEKSIIRKMRPPAAKVNKIRNNKFKG